MVFDAILSLAPSLDRLMSLRAGVGFDANASANANANANDDFDV